MPKYTVQIDGFIMGNHHKKGETVEMSEKQAKYLMAPMSDVLKPVGAKKPAPKALLASAKQS